MMKCFWPLCLLLMITLSWVMETQAQQFGPGVLKVIEPVLSPRDSYSLPMELPGVTAEKYSANYVPDKMTLRGQTRSVVFFRDVWQHEFAFLGLRQVKLNVKQSDGTQVARNYWYMVYRIRNTGKNLSYDQVKEDPRFEHIRFDLKQDKSDFVIKEDFMPRFSLEGWVRMDDGKYVRKAYRDKILPEVKKQIQYIEDKELPLLDTVQMMHVKFPAIKSPSDPGIWGVAIWEDVDPRIDYVSVFVTGLTNAIRLEAQDNGEVEIRKKTLQLNFWRPGDSVSQQRDRIDYGIPLVDTPAEQIEICRRYNLPGPLIRGYLDSTKAHQNVLVVELDAEVNLKDFTSTITPGLDQGQWPEKITAAFADAGVNIPDGTAITPLIPGTKWQFSLDNGGQTERYILQLEPQFWEPEFGGIRFIKSLDYLWIYR